jgi:lysophospholipase L1-like esterase
MKNMLSLALMFLTLSVFSVAADSDFKYPDPNRWTDDLKSFDQWDAKNAFPANPILFVGSSTFRLWNTADAFPGLPVINRGFGGSWMADSLHFVDRLVLRYKPSVVVIYAGDNDIAGGLPAEAVHSDFVKLTAAIRAALPDTPIIGLAIKPSQSRWKLWPEMKKANQLNSDFAQSSGGITFVDAEPVLFNADGLPDPAFFESDALHLNKAGYEKVKALLAPVLAEQYNSFIEKRDASPKPAA